MDIKLRTIILHCTCWEIFNDLEGGGALLRKWAVQIPISLVSFSSRLIVTTQFISLRAQRRKWLHHRPMKITQRHWWAWYWEVITAYVNFHRVPCQGFVVFFQAVHSTQVPCRSLTLIGKIGLWSLLIWAQRNIECASSDAAFVD